MAMKMRILFQSRGLLRFVVLTSKRLLRKRSWNAVKCITCEKASELVATDCGVLWQSMLFLAEKVVLGKSVFSSFIGPHFTHTILIRVVWSSRKIALHHYRNKNIEHTTSVLRMLLEN